MTIIAKYSTAIRFEVNAAIQMHYRWHIHVLLNRK